MPRDFKRTDRMADAIQRELAHIIQHEIREPGTGMVTISLVEVSKDLAYAKVYVNVFPDEQAKESVEALNKAARFIRGLLSKRMTLRVTPTLRFFHDETTLQAQRLSKLIDNVCARDKNGKNPC